MTCAGCGVLYSEQRAVPDFVLQDEPDSEHSLAEKLASVFPDDSERVRAGLALQELLEFPLAPALDRRDLPLDLAVGWGAGGSARLSAHAESGLVLESDDHDPCLFSPELDLPLAQLRGVRVRLAVSGLDSDEEVLQVFFRTLERPLWWERASTTASYRVTDSEFEVELGLPARSLFGADDVLTGLRLDPSHAASRSRLLRVELL